MCVRCAISTITAISSNGIAAIELTVLEQDIRIATAIDRPTIGQARPAAVITFRVSTSAVVAITTTATPDKAARE